ncbi:GNAT family N-acetyltransferase [Spongisporangium articulatum]|uniref:GNAT family N-acetyltransferase n=1 Tax=Spongisporangium articulatum TaxID=3362603 RepID=A0ABW8AIL0_9ACTN
MTRRLAPLTLDNVSDLPTPCRSCVSWELDAVAGRRAREMGDTAFEKEAWISATLLEWGSCGRVAYVDDRPAGFVTYAPPAFVPRSLAFPTSPVSADAVLLMTARVMPQYAGSGLARMLVQACAKDLSRRGVKAIEAFGLAAGGGLGPSLRAAAAALPIPGRQGRPPTEEAGAEESKCLAPADLFSAVGFKTVRQHHRYPRMRLELKTAISWREDVELALERILGTVRVPALSSTSHS